MSVTKRLVLSATLGQSGSRPITRRPNTVAGRLVMIKARNKTQRTDTESLGLQHESHRGRSGARLGTRGTWISSLPSGVGSYAKKKERADAKKKRRASSVALDARRMFFVILRCATNGDCANETGQLNPRSGTSLVYVWRVNLCGAETGAGIKDPPARLRSSGHRGFSRVGFLSRKRSKRRVGDAPRARRHGSPPPTHLAHSRDASRRGRIDASRGLEEARAEPVQVHERDGRG